MVIKIKRLNYRPSSHGSALLLGVIVWYVIAGILTGFFGLSKSIVYFGDILNIWLFMNALYKFRNKGFHTKGNIVLLFIVIFSLIGLLSSIVNLESPILILWGIRQNFRYFVFYFSCLMYLKEKDIQILLKFVTLLFWISVPLCFYEALVVIYPRGTIVGDYVGGIYYGIQGVNAPLNIIMLIYCTTTLLNYFEKKCTFSFVTLMLTAALCMSALAELKVFLVQIVIIVIIAMVRKGVSIKGIILICVGMLVLGIAVQMFVQLNGKGRAYYTTDYLSISGMIKTIFRKTGYDGVGDLNRFTAVQDLTVKFFSKDLIGFLFGLGLGNADYSLGYEALQSQFYRNYNWMHYQWFSISFVFIETGIIGLITYIMIFISALKQGLKNLEKKSFYQGFHMIMTLMMLIMIVYNPSLKNEQCGFILYLILAISAVIGKESEERRLTEKDIRIGEKL